MILEKIREKSYYIPFIIIIILIMMSTLHLNAILTNRLQNTIYIDIMSLLCGILFLCIFAIIIILPVEILLFFQIIIKFIQETIIQITTPIDITLINTILMDIISMNTIPTDATLMNAISIDTTPTETTHIETIPMETTHMDIITETTHTDTTTTDTATIETTHTETIDNNINNTYIKVDSTNKDNFLRNKNKEKNKLNIAEKYIIETFTGLCSEEEIKNIYAAIKGYSNRVTDFSNYPSIGLLDLNSYDLYHFGWNIWNHFRGRRRQVVIANLLKAIFAENFSTTDVESIKRHLKNDEDKGIIKIKKDLFKPNEQKK
jgi:hypothetical protein